MGVGFKVLALMVGFALGGSALAQGGDLMVFVEVPKGTGFTPEVGALQVGSCPGSRNPMKPEIFMLEVVGQSTMKNGKQRYILAIPTVQKALYKKAYENARSRTDGCKPGVGDIAYSPMIKLCREKDESGHFVRIEWGVINAAGLVIGQRTTAGIKLNRSMPLCAG